RSTCSRVDARTGRWPLKTCETVVTLTPALTATSSMVTLPTGGLSQSVGEQGVHLRARRQGAARPDRTGREGACRVREPGCVGCARSFGERDRERARECIP